VVVRERVRQEVKVVHARGVDHLLHSPEADANAVAHAALERHHQIEEVLAVHAVEHGLGENHEHRRPPGKVPVVPHKLKLVLEVPNHNVIIHGEIKLLNFHENGREDMNLAVDAKRARKITLVPHTMSWERGRGAEVPINFAGSNGANGSVWTA